LLAWQPAKPLKTDKSFLLLFPKKKNLLLVTEPEDAAKIEACAF